MLRWVRIALCSFFWIGIALGQEKPGPPFSAGEIIIKFSENSQGARLSTQAVTEGNSSNKELNSYFQSLSSQVGVPLQVKQLSSGGNLVVSIPPSQLVSGLLKCLRQNADIENVRPTDEQNASAPAIEVELRPGSPEHQKLQQAQRNGFEGEELQAIAADLQQYSGVPMQVRALSSNRLLLTIKLRELTSDVATRLSKLSGIQYAQPNFLRYPMRPN